MKLEQFCVEFSDMWQNYDYLSEKGYQGGGATWECLAESIISTQAPELATEIRLDGESDCLAIWSSSQTALDKMMRLIGETNADRTKLDAMIAHASANGYLE
ncbi:MAG: hypothetical protein HOP19_07730 [Acidobacteria bacterium]|nr:hypothetical protein [Acidobacteriota bacterium]